MFPRCMFFRRCLLVLAASFCILQVHPAGAVPEGASVRTDVLPAGPSEAHGEGFRAVHGRDVPLSMFLDETRLLDIQGIQEHSTEFEPLDSVRLRRDGALWLKLSMADVKNPLQSSLWLDLGIQEPKGTRVWMLADGGEWTSVPGSESGLYPLRSAGERGQVLVRLNGLPGLWFDPALRSPEDFDVSADRLVHLPAVAVLAVLSLLSLLLGITGRRAGHISIALLAAAAAVQTAWGVAGESSGSVTMGSLPGILAAGMAFVVLPHSGRVLMNTHRTAPFMDVLLLLLILPGVCVSVLPVFPGLGWTARLLPLWPAAGIVFLVPALVLLVRGIPGSGFFVLACLALGGGAAAAIYGLFCGGDIALWGAALPCGEVLGVVFLEASFPCRERTPEGSPSQDPPVRKVRTANSSPAHMEPTLRKLAGKLLDESCLLDQALNRLGAGSESEEIMEHADSMVSVSRSMAEHARGDRPVAALPEAAEQDFDLCEVIRRVFASVSAEADRRGLGLAWYVAPHLGMLYRGDSTRLTALLTMLLKDSVRAASHGAVRLQVCRSLASTHPGQLQFTISDNGEGRPPRTRSSLLLSRVWELAAEHGGDFAVDSTSQGLALTFGMEFLCLEEDGVEVHEAPPLEASSPPAPDGRLIILASADGLCRQLCAHYLDDMGYRLWEARDGAEALRLYAVSPCALVIFDGSLDNEAMAQTLAAIRLFEGEHALPAVPFLLLAYGDEQAERMGKAGCEEFLPHPVMRRDLRALVQWILAADGGPRPQPDAWRAHLAAAPAETRPDNASGMSGESMHMAAGMSTEADEGRTQATHVQPLDMGSPPVQRRRGWLSSLFSNGKRQNAPLEILSAEEPLSLAESSQGDVPVELGREDMVFVNSGEGTDDGVLELDSEHIVSGAGGIHELTDADRMLFQHLEAELCPVLEKLELSLQKEDADAVKQAIEDIASVAETYGMHTLLDMVRCFCAAWESGAMPEASQIIREMWGEASRQAGKKLFRHG